MTNGMMREIMPPMRSSFNLFRDYVPPVETADVATETVSGLMRQNVST